MTIKFFDKVAETDKNWLGRANGADDFITLLETYNDPGTINGVGVN